MTRVNQNPYHLLKMNEITGATTEAVIIMVGLILIGLLLKHRGILTDQHRPLFGKLVTDFALPATIFMGLVSQEIRIEILIGVSIMIVAVICHLVLSWSIGKVLHIGPRQLGAFMLVAAFGSSSTLGYALITQIFSGNSGAVTDAVMISELGVGIPLFFIGVIVVMHYGGQGGGSAWSSISSYLTSPIFIALISGCIGSFFLAGMDNPIWDMVLTILSIISASMVVFVALGVALMLRWIPLKTFGVLAFATIFLTLILRPLIALFLSSQINLNTIITDILVLETAMPSSMVAAVLADRYGCDGELGSLLVIATYIFSLVTIPLIMVLAP